MANWEHCPAVERDNDQDGGLWVFKDTSVPLHTLYETLSSDGTVDDFAERFGVGLERVAGVLRYEAQEFRDDLLIRPDGPGEITPIPVIEPTGNELPDWDDCPVVERVAGKVSGAWIFIKSRLALYVLYDNLASGATIEEFVDWYGGVEEWMVSAVLTHEAKALRMSAPVYADIV